MCIECVCVYTGERMRTSDCVYVSVYAYSGAYEEKAACMWMKKEHMDVYKEKAHQLMRPTRLRADSRGTPTARGRQCRMSKKRTRGEREGGVENKNTHNTQINLNNQKLGEPLSLPQTSRVNPVQCCSTHQENRKHIDGASK